ncbi:hypothetical protein CK503_09730 [Aliifodinibius salipaludis]|uniref:DUF5723 domain-containing protein n=1 Tax=Fodinibius salipaludis TaxID=2032627 RepID=A0A2A2G9U2_9BACT|nr:DUF5723 family protein [Aliifodinibius salipaludis]PAU93940.1 hypothetical protein CK503_09730 [Aliifodinibius salipaludis]
MKFFKKLLSVLVVAGVIIGWGSLAQAQSGHYSAKSLGLGGTGTAYLDTYHANFVNPANLMLNADTKPSTSIGLLGGLSATAGGPLMNISVYNRHFTSGNVVGSEALDEWFGSAMGNSRAMGLEIDVIPLAGAWRGEKVAFSLAFRNRALFSGSINRGFSEILLRGISQERFSEPEPVNFSSKGVAFSELSAGLSLQLLELPSLPGIGKNVKVFAGVAPKYLVPHYTSSIDFNSTLQVTNSEVIHDFSYTFTTVGELTGQFEDYYQARQDPNFEGEIGDFVDPDGTSFTETQGSGFGVDVGGTVEMDLAGPLKSAFSWIGGAKKLRVGLSITDIGSITYDSNAGQFSANETFTWDGIDIEDGLSDNFADSVRKEIYQNYEPSGNKEITEKLPTKLNFGAQLQAGKLGFAFDVQKGLYETGMNSSRLAIGLGAEYKLFNAIPLRAGYRTGGLTSSSITVGTGIELRNFEFTVAGLTVPNSESRGSGIGGAWSGLVIRF